MTLKFIDTTAASVVTVSAADAHTADRGSLRLHVSSTGSPETPARRSRRYSVFRVSSIFRSGRGRTIVVVRHLDRSREPISFLSARPLLPTRERVSVGCAEFHGS